MCRFVAYLGRETSLASLITEPVHSIIHQSTHSKEREEPLNGDGFGVAWYAHEVSEQPTVFKDVSPAWNNQNLLNIARVATSRCIFAHVRAATAGLPVTQLNCHPFACGPYTFMHNGTVANFLRIRRRLLKELSDDVFNSIQGSTDSELLFGLFLERMRSVPSPDVQVMHRALIQSIEIVESLSQSESPADNSLLNLAVTDGRCAVVTRYISDGSNKANSLYYHIGDSYKCVKGLCQMVQTSESAKVVLVASEPLSDREQWSGVPANHALLIPSDLSVEVLKIANSQR